MPLSLTQSWTFLREFAEHPSRVGTCVSGSNALARRVIRMASVPSARHLVELGAGTGSLTREFLRCLRPYATLTAVEISPRFASCLQAIRDRRLAVACRGAEQLSALLRERSSPAPDVVVSGIPFSALPKEQGRHILEQVWSNLAPGGRFIAYQFRSHVAHLAEEVMGSPRKEREWWNIPPLRLYCWEKPLRWASAQRRPRVAMAQ